jgi:hypothetical protein
MNRETPGQSQRPPQNTPVFYVVLVAVVLLTIWGGIYLWRVLGSVVEWGM